MLNSVLIGVILFLIISSLAPHLDVLFRLMITIAGVCLLHCGGMIETFKWGSSVTPPPPQPPPKDSPSMKSSAPDIPLSDSKNCVFDIRCDEPYKRKDYCWNLPSVDSISQWGCNEPQCVKDILRKQAEGREQCNLVDVPRWGLCEQGPCKDSGLPIPDPKCKDLNKVVNLD